MEQRLIIDTWEGRSMREGEPPAYNIDTADGEVPDRKLPRRLYGPEGNARQLAAETSAEAERAARERPVFGQQTQNQQDSSASKNECATALWPQAGDDAPLCGAKEQANEVRFPASEARMSDARALARAGDGNRTRLFSLGS